MTPSKLPAAKPKIKHHGKASGTVWKLVGGKLVQEYHGTKGKP